MSPHHTILLTGATGTLGSLATTALLREDNVRVVAPVRAHHRGDAVAQAVAGEIAIAGGPIAADWRTRLHQVPLPVDANDPDAPEALRGLDEVVHRFDVDEIVHCAGCLSYFDEVALRAVNVELTRRFVLAARRWNVRRFVHISTAFASGFVEGPIREQLHDSPASDPTFYTESKRLGEQIVASGEVPFLILRPSIVIGDSRHGHYHGPRYGLYQLWSGVERFLLDEYHAEVHYVAPRQTIPLLHQDAFQTGFMAAWRQLPDNSICHLTSRSGPSIRDLADLLITDHLRSRSVVYYERLADVPLASIPPAQRAFLGMAAVNIEISSRNWQFDTTTLDSLFTGDTAFADATISTVQRCQTAYFSDSERLARYHEKFKDVFPARAEAAS